MKIYNRFEDFIGSNGCYLYTDKDGPGKLLVLAPHEGIVDSEVWLRCRNKKLYPSGN